MSTSALERAIQAAGSQAALAEKLNCTQQAISVWKSAGKVSRFFVLPVEEATGVSRHDLRPDLYPRERAA